MKNIVEVAESRVNFYKDVYHNSVSNMPEEENYFRTIFTAEVGAVCDMVLFSCGDEKALNWFNETTAWLREIEFHGAEI